MVAGERASVHVFWRNLGLRWKSAPLPRRGPGPGAATPAGVRGAAVGARVLVGFLSRVPCGQNRPGSRLCAWEGLSDPGQGLRRCKVSGVGGTEGQTFGYPEPRVRSAV